METNGFKSDFIWKSAKNRFEDIIVVLKYFLTTPGKRSIKEGKFINFQYECIAMIN